MTPEIKTTPEQRFGPNTDAIEAMLARIKQIPWFQPDREPSGEELQGLVDEFRTRLNAAEIPVRVIKNDWNTAWNAAFNTAWDAALETAWDAVSDAVEDAASDTARVATWNMTRGTVLSATLAAAQGAPSGMALNAGLGAIYAAKWETVADLMPGRGYSHGNPFESLLKIYGLGCWPIGVVENKEGSEEFVVFIPPEAKSLQ